jgi:hypothetical protein
MIIVCLGYGILRTRPQIIKNYNIKVHPKAFLDNIYNHTAYKKHDSKKVYVYMSIDYPKLPEYGKYSIAIMRLYCEKHGYDFKVYNHNSVSNLSPYWIRVKDMYNLLESTEPDSIIVYFDLDAIVHPKYFSTRLESIMASLDDITNRSWDMYVSMDPYPGNYEMNTGIMMVRNTDWAQNFASVWFKNYPKSFWKKDANTLKWQCNNCLWAGDEYEQGMFNRLYQRDIMDSQEHILPVDTSILGNNSLTKSSFTLHLMQYSNEQREKHFREMYERVNVESTKPRVNIPIK